jgi:hypothetical protein
MEISFKRTKYRMDTFYIEQIVKVIMLGVCVGWLVWGYDDDSVNNNNDNIINN